MKVGLFKHAFNYVEFSAFIVAAKIAGFLPDKFCYWLASMCGSLLFCLRTPLGKLTTMHLLHAGVAKSSAQAKQLARSVFISFMKLSVDIFKNEEKMHVANFFRDGVSISGPESARKRFFPSDGSKASQAIVICAHFGNWEVAGPAYAQKSKINLVSVMRPFDNPLVGAYILSRRTGFGHSVCDKRGGIKIIIKALRQGNSVALLIDQHAARKDGGIEAQFFGHPARTHSTPAKLHLMTGIPILVYLCRRVNDDFKFELIISDPIERKPSGDKDADILAITQKINDEVEAIIRKYPEQWLWPHKRWLDIDRNGSSTPAHGG